MKDTGTTPVIVLAGGLGTRLRAITQDRCPKPMVPVMLDGQPYPFLEFVLAAHKARGFDDVVICIGHLGQQIVDHFADGSRFGIKIRYAEAETADTGLRVLQAQAVAKAPVHLVVCGDVYLPIDARAFLRSFATHPDWMVALASVRSGSAGAVPNVCADESGTVLAHGDVRAMACEAVGIEGGTLAVREKALGEFATGKDFSLTADLFPQLLRARQLGTVFVETDFFDIGTPEGYYRFCSFAAAGGARPLSLTMD
ncbi:sugar phosphate nucleotidyltransferase [Yoonia sp.]|uniref:sugar phosphate nucleotidyltransferase n=1 Tax=Yoonia sp. TaxID=2212373 RepID=UPI0023B63DD5